MKLQLEGKAVVHDEGDLTLAKLAELVNSLELAGTPPEATVRFTHYTSGGKPNGWDSVAKWEPEPGVKGA